MEVTPPTEVPEQAPPTDAEKEEIASNPLPAKDEVAVVTPNEAALVVPDEATPINLKEDEPTVDTTNDSPHNLFFYFSLSFLTVGLLLFFFCFCWDVIAYLAKTITT